VNRKEKRDALKRGVELFNAGDFFEFHEKFEAVWLTERGDTRTFLQALIHIGVGFYHLQNGNAVGLRNQIQKGLSKLKDVSRRQPQLLTSLGKGFPERVAEIRHARTSTGVRFPLLPSILPEIRV